MVGLHGIVAALPALGVRARDVTEETEPCVAIAKLELDLEVK